MTVRAEIRDGKAIVVETGSPFESAQQSVRRLQDLSKGPSAVPLPDPVGRPQVTTGETPKPE